MIGAYWEELALRIDSLEDRRDFARKILTERARKHAKDNRFKVYKRSDALHLFVYPWTTNDLTSLAIMRDTRVSTLASEILNAIADLWANRAQHDHDLYLSVVEPSQAQTVIAPQLKTEKFVPSLGTFEGFEVRLFGYAAMLLLRMGLTREELADELVRIEEASRGRP